MPKAPTRNVGPSEPRRAVTSARASASSARPRTEVPSGGDLVTSLQDPRAVQMLASEYAGLQSARSLVYNEAFTRGAMFLSFLSMSLVGLALVAQALPLERDFVLVAVVVLAFDLVVGLTTYGRIVRANYEDYLALQAMARIRHAYGEVAPILLPYFSTSIHDDLPGVMASYGSPPTRGLAAVAYQLTTSATLVALVDSMIAGVLALGVVLAAGAATQLAFVVAAMAALGVFVALAALTVRFYVRVQASLRVRFPTSPDDGRG